MSLKLSAASFVNGVRSSGLVDPAVLETVVREMREAGGDANDSQTIAAELINRDLITAWQSDKLLQGRHKGFFLGRYRLLRLLGTGQMSAVYLGRHILMDHLVAIKVLPADKVGDTSYLGRFYREAKAVASLNHPNIIRAFDVDKQSEAGTEIHFFVMEYVDGKLLTDLIEQKEDRHIDFIQAADVVRQAAEGLSHAHDRDMVHRDIKPDNLLVTEKGEVKILDLGLARFFKMTDEESLTLKHDERVIGTADYLAPEQAIDSHTVDSRADIYGLGCTFYYALTGHPPFTDGTLVQRLMAHQSQPPPPVIAERPDVPETLLQILDRMLAKKAADRYQTAQELAADLTGWLLDNSTDDWKDQHLPMYAKLRLKAMLTAKPAPVAAEEATVDAITTGATKTESAFEKSASNAPKSESRPVRKSVAKPVATDKPSADKTTATEPAQPAKSVASKAKTSTKVVIPTPAVADEDDSETTLESTAGDNASASGIGRIVELAKKNPKATLVVSLVAAALLITVGVWWFKFSGATSARNSGHSVPSATHAANIFKK